MIITIDGPAGAGKSSVARELARRLGFRFLDTGAMYRAVALAAMRSGMELADSAALTSLTRDSRIQVTEQAVHLNGEEVTREIRTMEVTSVIHHVADNTAVRGQLVELQRRIADGGDFVTEGRDQGTIVFPDAECKIFLTATPEERARRRMQDLNRRGENLGYDEVLRRQNERDLRDRTREVGRLIAAEDAIQFTTDDKALEAVVDELERIARRKLGLAA